MSRDDGHGPQAGCTYRYCPIDDGTCPFLADEKKIPEPTVCKHEWRQVSNYLDLRFYCVHCLVIVDEEKRVIPHFHERKS